MIASPHDDPAAHAVLVVEDSGLIVAKIAQILGRAGYRVVGPIATVDAALALLQADDHRLDAATLDIDLRGERVFPVAERLYERNVPFLFLTGYTSLGVPDAWQHVPRTMKPFTAPGLLAAVADLVAGRPPLAGAAQAPGSAGRGEFDERIADAIRTSRNLIMERTIIVEATHSTRKADADE